MFINNKMFWTTILLLITCVFASEPNKIVSIINKERRRHDLEPIVYNYELENKLIEFKNGLLDQYWFYEDSPWSYTIKKYNRTNRLKGTFLNKFIDYPNFTVAFRDTVRKDISQIIQFRANQRNCFNNYRCSNDSFDYHSSCIGSVKDVFKQQRKCSFFHAYYPTFLLKELKFISCVKLNVVGKYKPDNLHQPFSFFCYRNIIENLFDRPF